MQGIMEAIFETAYLICAVTLGVLIAVRGRARRKYILFGVMALVLGFGDAFHLIPRIIALNSDGLDNHARSLGIGKLITSITMTVFYVLLYHFWQIHYGRRNNAALTVSIYALAAARIGLCLFPQNMWLSLDAPLSWGIYRNIPFLLLGGVLKYLFFSEARRARDKSFRFMWLAIVLSFLFYIPVVLFADQVPMIGMLMLPKTLAYVWMLVMGYLDMKKSTDRKTEKISGK